MPIKIEKFLAAAQLLGSRLRLALFALAGVSDDRAQ
jgi:hypothetical protein